MEGGAKEQWEAQLNNVRDIKRFSLLKSLQSSQYRLLITIFSIQ